MSVVLTTLLGYVGAMVTQVTGDVVHARASGRSRRRLAARAADEAQAVMLPSGGAELLDRLSAEQVRTLRDYLRAPVFAQLVRQALVLAVRPLSDDVRSTLRDQIRHSLRHTGVFGEDICFEVTDLVEHLIQLAVHDPASPIHEMDSHAFAIGATVAAAGERNADLLRRIESLAAVNGFADDLRDAARAQHTRLRLQHTGESRFVDYSALYVTPHLRSVRASSDSRESSTMVEVITSRLRTVVLGDPGAGKSTFAAKLVHDVAADQVSGLEGLVPLLLVVREHTSGLRHGHDTLVAFLEAACRRPHHLVPPPEALDYLLLNGRAIVVIDGLDELGSAEHRRAFARLVEGFVTRFPLTRVIVTSRVVGYTDATLEPDLFPVATVSPFTEEQISEYVTKWFTLDPGRSLEQQEDYTRDFLRESASARDLCANPLMLSLLCALYSSTHYIPRNRPEIYERCAELLFVTWDQSREIEVPHRFSAFVRPAVQRLAWQLFTDKAGRQVLPRAELTRSLAEYLTSKRFEDPDEALQAAEEFLDFCAGRAWVLTDMGVDAIQPQYGFVHRTFLEYFAASQLVKSKPSPDAVWEKLEPHLGEASWSVVAHLAVQILDRTYEGGADDVLRLVLRHAKSALGSVRASTLLSFALETLDNVVPDNDVVREIVERAVLLACALPLRFRMPVVDDRMILVADQPLMVGLSVESPDNSRRIAGAIEEVLESAVLNPNSFPSAGMVCASLIGGPLGDQLERPILADQSVQGMPESVARWLRSLRPPTVESLREGGFSSLFDEIATGWYTSTSQAAWLINAVRAASSSRDTSDADVAVRLYSEIVTRFEVLGDRVSHVRIPRLSAQVAGLSQSTLPQAYGVALLLTVATAPVPSNVTASRSPAHCIMRAHGDVTWRAAARLALSDFGLPDEAHHILSEWIEGRVPGGETL